MAAITERITNLITNTVEEQGVTLWDVRFLKEGASHYLRIFIDKPDGITIDDCTAVSHAIDPILDEADPIDCPYYLEVCSPGIERELTKPFHFEYAIGKNVVIKLFKAIDGTKEIGGVLKAYNELLEIETAENTISIEKSAVAKAMLVE